jgi:hypothetical protein
MKILSVFIDSELPESCLKCNFGYKWSTNYYCHLKGFALKNRIEYVGEIEEIKSRNRYCPLKENK